MTQLFMRTPQTHTGPGLPYTQSGWVTSEVFDLAYGGPAQVHLTLHEATFDPIVVVASVTTSWAADEVEEVGDLDDPDAVGAVMDVVGDSLQGRQV